MDALDLLWERLGTKREDVTFARVGTDIRANYGELDPPSSTREMRVEVERQAVLDVVCEVCENAPELKSDWFAVSPAG